jgi:hypothetical protein
MSDFLKMDIFFFIATFGILIFSIFASLLAYYLVRIARNIHSITQMIEKEAHATILDFRSLRKDVREGVQSVKGYTKAFAGANFLKGVTNIVQAFMEHTQSEAKPAKPRTRKKKEPVAQKGE